MGEGRGERERERGKGREERADGGKLKGRRLGDPVNFLLICVCVELRKHDYGVGPRDSEGCRGIAPSI